MPVDRLAYYAHHPKQLPASVFGRRRLTSNGYAENEQLLVFCVSPHQIHVGFEFQ